MYTHFTWLWHNPPSRGSGHRLRSVWLRRSALLMAAMFLWSSVLTAPVYALTHSLTPNAQRLTPLPGVRPLTAQEMAHILGKSNPQVALGGSGTVPGTDKGPSGVSSWTVYSPSGATVDTGSINGATGSNGWTVSWTSGASATVSAPSGATVGGGYSVVWNIGPTGFPPHMEEYGGSFDVVQPGMSEDSGSAYPWERAAAISSSGKAGLIRQQVNTVNGNKMTTLPLVGWTARGGLPVAFALVHNSQSSHNSTLGQKWTHSFDIYGKTDGNGNVTLHWGDDQSYTFTKNIGGSFTAPAGIFDTLVKNGGGTYTLVTHDQITYQFNTSLQCTSLSDENSNTITLSYTSGVLTSITDPTSRSLTIAYSSGRISTITDPLSRVFTMHYDANGNLSQVDFPALGGTTYSYVLSYNTAHDLTDLETPRGYHWTFNYNSDDSLNWAKDPYSNETSASYTSTDHDCHRPKQP